MDLSSEYQKVISNLNSPEHYRTPIYYGTISNLLPRTGWKKAEHKLSPDVLSFLLKDKRNQELSLEQLVPCLLYLYTMVIALFMQMASLLGNQK